MAAFHHEHSPTVVRKPRKQRAGRNAVLTLLVLGVLLETLYFALYPLLAGPSATDDAIQTAFPWQQRLYLMLASPALTQFLTQISWLDPTNMGGQANLLLVFLGVASTLMLCAVLVGSRVARLQISQESTYALFWTVIALTGLFALTMLCTPMVSGVMSRDMLMYGLYGRMVVTHHVNPYTVPPTMFPQDLLQQVLPVAGEMGSHPPVAPAIAYGPVWLDISLLVTLLANNSVANILFGFRLLALVAHLVNAILLWMLMGKLKPETRVSTTILYAWNPLLLLLGISQMHMEIVLVAFLLLAVLFFKRGALMLSWVFVLLTILINPLCLLLLPLFLRLLIKEIGFLPVRERILWWPGMLTISTLVIVLAYAPYWPGWGLTGLEASISQLFRQSVAVNSLAAALLKLPLSLPAPVLWLIAPSQWSLLALAVTGLFLLLSMWLADTLEMTLLCTAWIFLLLVLLEPTYWPWYSILPFVLALCSTNRNTVFLAIMLTFGALLSFYYWQWPTVWAGQALSTVGLPFLIWGWILFFIASWHMFRANGQFAEEAQGKVTNFSRWSRPPWLSHPSWPSRPVRR